MEEEEEETKSRTWPSKISFFTSILLFKAMLANGLPHPPKKLFNLSVIV